MNPATWERVRKVPLQKILPRVKVKKNNNKTVAYMSNGFFFLQM